MTIQKAKFNIKFWILLCGFGFICNAYALTLDKVKIYFLESDYKSAALEGERILAACGPDAQGLDELYYILGLSYMKSGNLLRASDIFEIILEEFKDSRFSEEAKLGLGDTYFLKGDFVKAEAHYKELIMNNPGTKFKSQVYYRLSQAGFKKGDVEAGRKYLDKLKADFPLSPELRLNKDLSMLADSDSEIYYTVQVGSFSKEVNAAGLAQKLKENGYPAYIEEAHSKEDEKIYRVRVGKLRLRQEVEELRDRLSQEGYPTKIFP